MQLLFSCEEAERIKAEAKQQTEAESRQQARAIIKEAETEAERIKAEAKQQAESESRQQARALLEETETEAARIKTEARQQAEAESGQQARVFIKEAEAEAARLKAEAKQQAEVESRQQARAFLKETEAEAERIKAEARQQAETESGQKSRAFLKEAEAEAERIKAEAKRQAREIAVDAKVRAEGATQLEANEILLTAKGKADLIETAARQQANEFLAKAREQMLDEISSVNHIWTEEVRGAYFRLFSSLHDLMAEVEQVQTGWRNKTAELLEGKNLELKEYEARHFPTIEVTELIDESKQDAVGEEDLGLATEQDIEQPVQPQEEEAVPPKSILEEDLGSTVEHNSEHPVQLQEKEEIPPESTLSTTKKSGDSSPKGKSSKARGVPIESQDPNASYVGEVELSLVPPVDLAKMSELYEHLQSMADLKVLRTVGSWDRGTIITVVLEKPMPLVKIICEMINCDNKAVIPVKEVVAPQKGLPLGSKGKALKRIEIDTDIT
ncbi:hypothetical protein ACFLVI_02550 [Chloroflexota bacterium]